MVDKFKTVTIPIYELDETGAVKPNPLFHRSWDKLHSRCIEYPFAASQIGDAKCILDVGTAQADPNWIRWLEDLPIEVHATDYEQPLRPIRNITFHRADVRKLPVPDNAFDAVLAVSVIEHIGLQNPQVLSDEIPSISNNGDIEAVHELMRVLKPDGKLIMTFPFGISEGLIGGGAARNYTAHSIKRFESLADPVLLDYYEYQYKDFTNFYNEYAVKQSSTKSFKNLFLRKKSPKVQPLSKIDNPFALSGAVTWRRIPMRETEATHYSHIDGVICGIWKKR